MKNKTLTALLVTAAVMVAACGSQPVIPRTATSTPSPAGIITEFPIPTANSSSFGITAGPDGNLWFTECVFSSSGCTKSQIGHITPTGQFTEFPLPNPNSFSGGITAGPDGNLWFTECVSSSSGCTKSQIGRITPTGQFTEFPLPNPNSNPSSITRGPDGNLWFTEAAGRIGRITSGK